jgi:DNA-binding NarL/FixJ family response regulator
VIISDYDIPGQNGIQFLEAVRERYSTLPFVLYTGRDRTDLDSEAVSAEPTDYLKKRRGSTSVRLSQPGRWLPSLGVGQTAYS